MSRYFKSNMTYFAPIHGHSALEAGLLHDFRFYGSLDTGEKKGSDERVCNADKPHKFGQQEDAFFKLIFELFRSPTGTLAPHVAGQDLTNFHCVFSPQKVALLLNYTQELSQLMQPFQTNETGKKADNLKANHERALPKLRVNLKAKYKNISLTEEEKKKKGLTTSVQSILTSVENCALQESETDPNKKFLYPDHTTEQIILAYFCQNANTQKDVLELMSHLNDHIIGADQHLEIQNRLDNLIINHKTEDDLLSREDLDIIVRKDSYGIDDVYALTHAYLFEKKVTLYFEGSTLISNGSCHIYDRTQDITIASSYADCGETAARHVINMIAYHAEGEIFDFTHLKTHMKDHPNPYFDNFLQFYEHQTPDQINDGSIDMRSRWNRVVGDLNKEGDGPKVRYLKSQGEIQYELDPGIINLLHVFNKIFSLSLDPLEDTADLKINKIGLRHLCQNY